jgi:hypothetical protein
MSQPAQNSTPASPVKPTHTEIRPPHTSDGIAGLWPPTSEWALVVVTIVLAFFTYRLWAATSNMVRSTERDMRASIDQATRAASAMESIAESVAASAAASQDAVGTIKDQGALLKRSYIANNPPVLEIRDVVLGTVEEEDAIQYTLINVGGSNATIVEHRAIDDWKGIDRPLPVNPQFEDIADASKGTLLEPSVPLHCTYLCAGESMARHLITKGTAMTHAELFFTGYIVFEDENSVRRRMDFCRGYDIATRSFSVNRDA